MLSQLAAMTQYVGIGAARLFKSISQDGQAVERALIVNRSRDSGHGAFLPPQPGQFNCHRAEWVAENVTKYLPLDFSNLCSPVFMIRSGSRSTTYCYQEIESGHPRRHRRS